MSNNIAMPTVHALSSSAEEKNEQTKPGYSLGDGDFHESIEKDTPSSGTFLSTQTRFNHTENLLHDTNFKTY